MKLPKMPKIKIKKLTKIQKLRIGQVGAMLLYTAGVVTYGVLNYIEGQEGLCEQLKDMVKKEDEDEDS